jgi:hypothetical protein
VKTGGGAFGNIEEGLAWDDAWGNGGGASSQGRAGSREATATG